jgi:hypothetical protein
VEKKMSERIPRLASSRPYAKFGIKITAAAYNNQNAGRFKKGFRDIKPSLPNQSFELLNAELDNKRPMKR